MLTCKDCKFWADRGKDYNLGECRLRPPRNFHIDSDEEYGPASYWPCTKPTDWCGEALPKVRMPQAEIDALDAEGEKP